MLYIDIKACDVDTIEIPDEDYYCIYYSIQ